MLRGFCLAAAAALLWSAHTAQAQVQLQHKFVEGRKTTAVTKITTKQTLTLSGMDLDSASKQTQTITTVEGKRGDDGVLRVSARMEGLQAAVTLPGGSEIAYDSAAPEAEPPGTQFDFLLDVFKALSQSSWTVVYNKENRVTAVDGRGKFLESLDENIRQLMAKQFDPEYLAQQANDELARIPSRPVSPGDSWELTTTARLDSGQRMTFKTTYTYDGVVDRDGKQLDRIKLVTTDVDYATDADAPVTAVMSDLKVATSEGEILFDRQAGRVVESHDKVQIKGVLTLDIGGMEFPGTLDLTLQVDSKVK